MRTRINRKSFFKTASGVLIFLLLAGLLMPAAAEDGAKDEKEIKTLRSKHYYYKAFNRRDPFHSLISGEYEETENDLVDIYKVRLVGVLTGGMERFAMLESDNGFGYILKAGDPIRNGRVLSVAQRSLVARVSMYGQTNSITLKLEGVKGKGD